MLFGHPWVMTSRDGWEGWLAGWGDEEGKGWLLKLGGLSELNSKAVELRTAHWNAVFGRQRHGEEMERLEAEKHQDSYIWMGAREEGLDEEKEWEWRAKAHDKVTLKEQWMEWRRMPYWRQSRDDFLAGGVDPCKNSNVACFRQKPYRCCGYVCGWWWWNMGAQACDGVILEPGLW